MAGGDHPAGWPGGPGAPPPGGAVRRSGAAGGDRPGPGARPEVIFCDEPTGALDSSAAAVVLGLLREAVDTGRQTVVLVSHDPVAASYADRVVFLADGTIVDDVAAPGAGAIAERLARLGGRAPRGARA